MTSQHRKAVILGYTRPKKDTTKRKSKKAKGLGARQKRVMKIFQIKAEHQRYELFLPLHQLWRHYILDLCGGLKPSGISCSTTGCLDQNGNQSDLRSGESQAFPVMP
uniref:Uncharacterized protein n=1 Tax=Nothobranchius furzeri TaxID=105023 RepID=A0A8C6M5G9_NOTFU